MAETGLKIIFEGAADNLKQASEEASSSVESFGKKAGAVGELMSTGFKNAAIIGAGAIAGLGAFLYKSAEAADESDRMLTSLNAVLKSTAGVAGVTREAALGLSKQIENETALSDEAALSAENMLLTFTKIGKESFPGATRAVVDMATAMNDGLTPASEQLKDTAIQVGKALSDPQHGLLALRRVGVQFTDAQVEVIKSLYATGRVAEGQALILKELNTEFGGRGAAAAQTFTGRMKQLKEVFDDVQEVIGKKVLTALAPFLEKVTVLAKSIRELAEGTKSFEDVQKVLVDQFGDFGRVIVQVIDFFRQHKEAVQGLAIVLGALAGATIIAAIVAFVSFVGPALLFVAAITAIVFAIMKLKDFLPIVAAKIGEFFSSVGAKVNQFREDVIGKFNEVKDGIVKFVSDVWTGLVGGVGEIFNQIGTKLKWFQDNWAFAIGFVIGFVASLPFKLQLLMMGAVTAMVNAIFSVNWLAVMGTILNAAGSVFSAIGTVAHNAWNAIVSAANSAWNSIVGAAQATIGRLASINWGAIPGQIASGIANGAWQVVQAIINAVTGAAGGAGRAASQIGSNIVAGIGNSVRGFISGIGAGIGLKIPGFATGGVVPGPVGQPTLAVVHGGETVIPAGKSGGEGVNITFGNVSVRDDSDITAIVREVTRALGRQNELTRLGAY